MIIISGIAGPVIRNSGRSIKKKIKNLSIFVFINLLLILKIYLQDHSRMYLFHGKMNIIFIKYVYYTF